MPLVVLPSCNISILVEDTAEKKRKEKIKTSYIRYDIVKSKSIECSAPSKSWNTRLHLEYHVKCYSLYMDVDKGL